ncbi:hypothetical protein [Bacillus marasmi]|uniref:hypothetical protein n=1 Tax=Bacillus marasmi TaxID=1926279 RepID=UPI0011C90AD1|nr:hypothetical protein [Bacillus marasmi]
MISKTDVIERLNSLIGQELTGDRLHEALFCEEKHQKILRRYYKGKYTYVEYKIHTNSDGPSFVDITIPGNPNTFRVGLEESDEKLIIQSEARINYTYL